MEGRLNKEQQKMVEDNHDLIYHFMNTYNLSENDVTDWYGELAVELCESALRYNETQNVDFRLYSSDCFIKRINELKYKTEEHKTSNLDL